MQDYLWRIKIRSILITFLETTDCTDKSQKDETCLSRLEKHLLTVEVSESDGSLSYYDMNNIPNGLTVGVF